MRWGAARARVRMGCSGAYRATAGDMMSLRQRGSSLWASSMLLVVLVGCRDAASPEPSEGSGRTKPASSRDSSSERFAALERSWDVCNLLAPETRPGVYGSDLGYTVEQPTAAGEPSTLAVLFGDTWATMGDVCAYPVQHRDDLQATLPAERPRELGAGAPGPESESACSALQYATDSPDPASWRRIRLFPDASERDDARALDTGMLRTPIAAFSDGQHVFGMFIRHEATTCTSREACPAGMVCSADGDYRGKAIGGCQPNIELTPDAPPVLCLSDVGCSAPRTCDPLPAGLCLAPEPYPGTAEAPAPGWYADDPRRAVVQNIYVASAFWPDRPEDYATGFRFATNKFVNVSARTVAMFDPNEPANNDYRPGHHTLLVWGRPGAVGDDGFQPLMFLLAQPLDGLLDAQGAIRWSPRFFAGFGEDGRPTWSEAEVDAQPVYGGAAEADPEFDFANHMSVSYVEALQRWVMFYGGSVPAWLGADKATLELQAVTYPEPLPGAIHMRSAAHPWGKSRRDAAPEEAWSSATPVLSRASVKHQLACDDDDATADDCELPSDGYRPADLINALGAAPAPSTPEEAAAISAMCFAGSVALDTQYSLADDSGGHLYGTNIIDRWTQDVSAEVDDLPRGERAVELYWNVSTWNPYQVLLMKTQLRGDKERVY